MGPCRGRWRTMTLPMMDDGRHWRHRQSSVNSLTFTDDVVGTYARSCRHHMDPNDVTPRQSLPSSTVESTISFLPIMFVWVERSAMPKCSLAITDINCYWVPSFNCIDFGHLSIISPMVYTNGNVVRKDSIIRSEQIIISNTDSFYIIDKITSII